MESEKPFEPAICLFTRANQRRGHRSVVCRFPSGCLAFAPVIGLDARAQCLHQTRPTRSNRTMPAELPITNCPAEASFSQRGSLIDKQLVLLLVSKGPVKAEKLRVGS